MVQTKLLIDAESYNPYICYTNTLAVSFRTAKIQSVNLLSLVSSIPTSNKPL